VGLLHAASRDGKLADECFEELLFNLNHFEFLLDSSLNLGSQSIFEIFYETTVLHLQPFLFVLPFLTRLLSPLFPLCLGLDFFLLVRAALSYCLCFLSLVDCNPIEGILLSIKPLPLIKSPEHLPQVIVVRLLFEIQFSHIPDHLPELVYGKVRWKLTWQALAKHFFRDGHLLLHDNLVFLVLCWRLDSFPREGPFG